MNSSLSGLRPDSSARKLAGRSRRRVLASSIALLVAAAPLAMGVTKTWLGTDTLWDNASNWQPATEPALTDDALFPALVPPSGNTITLTSGETALSLTFREWYHLTGGSLALGGTGNVTVAAGMTARIDSVLDGSAGLTLAAANGLAAADAQAGGGTLTLTATNSYTGGTTVAAGALRFDRDLELGAAGAVMTLSGGSLSTAYGYLGARTVTVTGTSSMIDIARNATTNYSTFDANFTGAAGTTLTKTGIGNLILRNAQSFAGDFAIDFNAGWAGRDLGVSFAGTQLRDNATLLNIASLTIGSSSTLSLSNEAGLGLAVANRINDTAPVLLKGGTLHFQTKSAQTNDETIGATTLSSGMSGLTAQSQNAGSAARLFVTGNLARSTGATVVLAGNNLGGTAGDNGRIFINETSGGGAGPTLDDGLIGGWALAQNATTTSPGGLDFATYQTTKGVGNLGATGAGFGFAGYSANLLSAGVAADNIRVTATIGGVTTREINSLTIGTASTITLSSASDVLTIGTGGILNQNVATTITGGDITSGGGELFAHTAGGLTLAIASRITGSVALVKDLGGTLSLTGAVNNTYSGGTFVTSASPSTGGVGTGFGSTLITGTTNGLTYLGTGKVSVDQAFLLLAGTGATSFVGSLATPTYTASNMGQITISPSGAFAATEVFSIGAGSVIAGGASAANQGLNSLTRGVNVVLAPDAIVAHGTFVNGAVGAGADTIKTAGTAADLFYGLNQSANAGANQAIALGAGTPWKGLSTDRSDRSWTQGTITAKSDFFLQGLRVPGANAALTLGSSAGGTFSIVNGTTGNTPIRAFLLGNVNFNETSAVAMPGNLTLVATPGATFALQQPANLGTNADPALNAKLLLQAGSTLDINGTSGANYINGNATFEPGARLLANDTVASSFAGTGTLTFLPGSIIEVSAVNGLTGAQPFAVSPGTIVRLNVSNPVGLSARVGAAAVFELIGSGSRALTGQATPENLTLSGGVLTNGGFISGTATPTSGALSGDYGRVVVGAGGATFAATTGTTLTMAEDFDLQGNALTIGSVDSIDGNPKRGIVTIVSGGNKSTAASAVNVLPSIQLTAGASNALPDLAGVNLAAGATLLLNVTDSVETIGTLTGTGSVTASSSGFTPGTVLRAGNGTDFTFDGSFALTTASPGLIKTGAGRMDLTGTSASVNRLSVDQGILRLRGGGQVAFGTSNVNRGGTLTLDNAVGSAVSNRLGGTSKTVTLAGGTLNLIGSPSAAVTEAIGNFLTSGGGHGMVNITPGAGGATIWNSTALTPRSLSTFLLRGEKLGAAPGAGVATFLTTTPNLVGNLVANNNTTPTQALRPDFVSDTPTAGGVSGALSFVTQDNAANGFRMLTAAEYAALQPYTITSLNVALSAPAVIAPVPLLAGTTTQVQSLVFNAGSSSLQNNASASATNADGRLVVSSGGVLVQSGVNASINSPYLESSGFTYFHTYGNLTLNAALTNSFGGFVKAGPGTLTLGTGAGKLLPVVNGTPIVVNEGTLLLGTDNSFPTATSSSLGSGVIIAAELYLTGGVLDLNGNSQTFRIFGSANNFNANLNPGSGGNVVNSGAPATLTFFSGSSGAAYVANLFTGTLSGPIDLVKVSTNLQALNNVSPSTGTLTLRGGTLQLRDSGQLTGVTALTSNYSTLQFDNLSSLSNVANRLPASTPATLRGGTLELRGFSGENSSQQLGTVTIVEGSTLLNESPGNAGSVDLSLGNLVRNSTAGVRFNGGTNLGRFAPAGTMNGEARIILSQLNGAATPSYNSAQPVTTANGFLGGWATVNDSDFAAYLTPTAPLANAATGGGVSNYGNTTLGYPAYTTATTANFTTGLILDVTTDITLPAGATVGAVRLSGGALRQLLFTGANDLLNIESGGLLRTSNLNGFNIGLPATRGRLTAGGAQSTGTAELFLHANANNGSNNVINAAIVDNPNGAKVVLIKDLGGQVDLTAVNLHTGGTIVNGGTLRLNTPGADGSATVAVPGPLTINGGTVTLATPGQIAAAAQVTINGGGTLNLSNTAGDNTTIAGLAFGNTGGGSAQVTAPSAAGAGTLTRLTIAGNISSVNDSVGSSPTIAGTATNTQIQLDFGNNTTARTIDVSGISPLGLSINAPILNGRLVKTGPGMLTLGQPTGTGAVASSFTGGLRIEAGPVRIDAVGALSSNTNLITIGTGVAGTGAALVLNTFTPVPATASFALNTGVLGATTSGALDGPVSIAGDSTIAVNDFHAPTVARNLTLNGQLTGAGTLNVAASPVSGSVGTLTLTNNTNSFSGTLALQRNAFVTSQSATGVGSTLGSAAIALAGGSLNLRDSGTGSGTTLAGYGNDLTVTGNATITVGYASSVTSNNLFNLGQLNLNNTALTVTNAQFANYALAFTGAATLTGTATIHNIAAVTVGQLTGAGTLVKSNTGTLSVTAAPSAFTGGATVTGGTLRVALTGGGAALGSGPLVIGTGATLQSDPTSGTLAYSPSTFVSDGLLQVRSGVADFGSRFLGSALAMPGVQPFSVFTEKFSKPSDVGAADFSTTAADSFLALENANNFLTPNPGPGLTGPGVAAGTALNFTETTLNSRSFGYLGNFNQGVAYRGTITIGGVVPAGPVSFGTNSDDGSTLYVDLNGDHLFSSGERIVNNLGQHAAVSQIGTATLAAGTYDIAVAMYNGSGLGLVQATFAAGAGVPFGSQYTITPGGGFTSLGEIQIDANAQLIVGGFTTSAVRLNANSTLTLPAAAAAVNSTTGTLTPTGATAIHLGANHTLTTTVLSGAASGVVTKTGSGRLVIGSTHQLGASAQVQIDGGTVEVNSTPLAGSTGSFIVNAGGTLGGTGNLGNATVTVNAGGIIAPGASPGTLAVGGNLTAAANAEFKFELGGATPGDGPGFYDQLLVAGDAGFDQAKLSLSILGAYAPTMSTVFYLLATTGTRTGTFLGLPEGAPFLINQIPGVITYEANWTGNPLTSTLTGGNDVAIYNVPEPGAALLLGLGAAGLLSRRRRTR